MEMFLLEIRMETKSSNSAKQSSQKLNPTGTQSIWDLELSRDGSQVVYRGWDLNNNLQLYAVATASPGTANQIHYASEGHVTYHMYVMLPSIVIPFSMSCPMACFQPNGPSIAVRARSGS